MFSRSISALSATIVLLVAGCPGPTDPPAAAPTTAAAPTSTIASIDAPAVVATSSPDSPLVCRVDMRLDLPCAAPQPCPNDPGAAQPRCPHPDVPAPTNLADLPAPQYSTWPHWKITADGVPYYAGRPACTVDQAETIASSFADAGASIATRQWAIYVASREAGCDHTAYNGRGSDRSYCAFQLNALRGPLSPTGYLTGLGYTPTIVTSSLARCADAAAALWARCGKGPWIYGDYSCRRPTD